MKKNICGIMIDDLDKKSLTADICRRLSSKKKTVIYTPNPIMAQNAKQDGEFLKILNSSDYNIPDGNGLILASRLLNTPIPERICGIELAESLLLHASKHDLGVFFLGGKEGVAKRAAEKMAKKYAGLKICGTQNGYTKDTDAVIRKINTSGASLLYVCLGSPLQEKWICKNRAALPNVLLFMGLGGSLDVWSGDVARAPKVMQKSGTEWVWRMTTSPKRLKDLPKLVSFGFGAVKKRLSDVGIMHR